MLIEYDSLKILEAFENYVYLAYLSDPCNVSKIKYYKRRLSFLRDHIYEYITQGKQKLDLNHKFFDANIANKVSEVIKFGGIQKFKLLFLRYILNDLSNYVENFDVFIEQISYQLNQQFQQILTLRDILYIQNDEDFYKALFKLLKKTGLKFSYEGFKSRVIKKIEDLLCNYHGYSFFYEIYGVYKLIKKNLYEKGIEYVETGPIRRFDKIIEEICIIIPSNQENPAEWFKDNFKEFEKFALSHEVKKIGNTNILILKTSVLKVPILFIFCEYYLPLEIYFLLRYTDIDKIDTSKSLEDFIIDPIFTKLKTMNDFYEYLGVNPIPDELLDYPLIFEIAKTNTFSDLVSIKDIKGDLHLHTVFSDGKNTVHEMAMKALQMGYSYIGISDHIDYLQDKVDSYASFSKVQNLDILWAVEENIDTFGNLDYEKNKSLEKILPKLDYINLSIHSDFKLRNDQNYQRIINALTKGNILCHLTSRILGQREAIKLSQEDIFNIFNYANQHQKYIEINSHLDRLDVDYEHIINYRLCTNKELNIVINTDAHSTLQMEYMEFGVKWARKAMCKKHNVLNTKTLQQIKEELKCNRINQK
ncbi:MAG: PHP domain-containing protein [bacterium]